MKPIDQICYHRHTNPLTFSLFFHGASREVFTLLYGDRSMLDTSLLNISRTAHGFKFDSIGEVPDDIKAETDKLRALSGDIVTEEQLENYWKHRLQMDLPTKENWLLANWGVQNLGDIHVRYLNREIDGVVYLQIILLGLVTTPMILLQALNAIGINYDAYWVHEVNKTWGGFSTKGNHLSAFNVENGLIQSMEQLYQNILSIDIIEWVPYRAGILMIRDILMDGKRGLADFLIDNPIEQWENDDARIFFASPDWKSNCSEITQILTRCSTAHEFCREEIWKAELAMSQLIQTLYKLEKSDVGLLYYNLERLIQFGLDLTTTILEG